MAERLIPLTVPEVRPAAHPPCMEGRTSQLTLYCPGLCGDDTIRPKPGDVTTNDGFHY